MSRLTVLDVRPVEPNDRYEQIMAAYESLATGETLELTVDHDPECMYYTLRPPATTMRSPSTTSRKAP